MKSTKQAGSQNQKDQQQHHQKGQQQKTRQQPLAKKQGRNAATYQEHEHPESRMTD